MKPSYWQQQVDKPLYPDVLWSRPENRQGAGKLLIIGGQSQEFKTVAECYTAAEQAGVGTVRVLMPESTRKLTGMLPNIEYAPSNTSGSFSRPALGDLLEAASWADGVLLAGDLGKNSETSLMIDHFVLKYNGLLWINGAALQSISLTAAQLVQRNNTTLVLSLAHLRQLGIDLQLTQAVTSDAGHPHIAELLHSLTLEFPVYIVLITDKTVWTAGSGEVVSTAKKTVPALSNLSSHLAVWAVQQPEKIHQTQATAAYCI